MNKIFNSKSSGIVPGLRQAAKLKCRLSKRKAVVKGKLPFQNKGASGFSILELLIAMSITLVLLGITTAAFSGALRSRERETSRTDALTAAQAAINVMSREISNAGFGLTNNGIVIADSNSQ